MLLNIELQNSFKYTQTNNRITCRLFKIMLPLIEGQRGHASGFFTYFNC